MTSKNTTEIRIGENKTHALVDTGSQLTLASLTFFNKTKFAQCNLDASEFIFVKGVSGKHLKILGKIKLPVSIDGKIFHFYVHVVQDLNHSFILGIDFMERYGVSLHLGNKTLHIAETASVCPIKTSSGFCRSQQKVTIQAKHEVDIPVRVSNREHNEVVLIEPDIGLQFQNVMAAKCLVRVDNGRAVLRLCNPSEKDVVIEKNAILGTIADVHADTVTPLTEQPHSASTSHTTASRSKRKQKPPIHFNLDESDLSDEQKQTLRNFLSNHRDVFATNLSELGKSNRYSHKIETTDNTPIRMPFYRQNPKMQDEINRQVQELLDNGIVEESNSEYHSPVVLVKKKDGKYRFCVDYRKLNKVTKPLSFPLPRLESVFDTIAEAEAQVFSTFDLHSGYWQIQMDPETKHKAAFITRNGVYEWTRMGMGLRNSCVSFQMIMSQVLRGINWKFVLAYVDDIIVFSKNFDQHLCHLNQLFNRLKDANLTLKPTKCKFAAKQVKFLGHIVSKAGIQVDPEKTKVVQSFPIPNNLKDVRSFLGMCNYYRRFVERYSDIAMPLTSLLRKDNTFDWTDDCQNAFDTLKSKLTSAPILVHPNMNKPFILTTDASNNAIGYYLSQLDSGKRERVIAYGGRSLSKTERNYSTSERECLAIVDGIHAYQSYLAHSEFTVFTDHKPLQYLMKQTRLTGRLAKWALELQGYNFQIIHKKGSANQVADCLSRRQYETPEQKNTCDINVITEIQDRTERLEVQFSYDDQPVVLTTDAVPVDNQINDRNNLPKLQKQCDDFKHIYAFKESDILPDDEKLRKKTIATSEFYELCNGILYHWFQKRLRKAGQNEKWVKQIALPKVLRRDALQAYHDNNTAGGHLGIEKVMAAMKQKYHWPRMHQDIYDYIHSCDTCQRVKQDQHNRPPPLTSMPVDGPFERWHIDFLKLSKTSEGFQYVLLVVDSFTRWVEAFPMKTQDSFEVARVLFEQIFSRFGAPHKIVSDLGKQFTSNLVMALCEIFNVKRHFTSAYHPQSNSFCERNNRTIIQSLRAYCDKEQNNWPSKLPGILMALRNSPCTQSTEYSPYFMVFGKEMRLPYDVAVQPKDNLQKNAKEYVNELLANLKITHEIATQNVKDKQEKSKQYFDKKTKTPEYKLRDLVLLRDFRTPIGKSPKLVDKYLGPFYISELGPNYTYRLRRTDDHREFKTLVNASRLKPYTSPNTRPNAPGDGMQLLLQQDNEQNQNQEHEDVQQNTQNVVDPLDNPPELVQDNDGANEAQNDIIIDNGAGDNPIDDKVYPIDRILRVKKRAGKFTFYIKWLDGSKSWEPQENIPDELIKEYFVTHTHTGKIRKRKFPSVLKPAVEE